MKKNYWILAKKAIWEKDCICWDVASNMFPNQIVENVSHMGFFIEAVAQELKRRESRK